MSVVFVVSLAIGAGSAALHTPIANDKMLMFFDDYPTSADIAGVAEAVPQFAELFKGIEVEDVADHFLDFLNSNELIIFECSNNEGLIGAVSISILEVYTSTRDGI